MANHVIVLGGGVAGMSAAHELAERGFKVTVFEKQPNIPGGKARSVPVEGEHSKEKKPLPGEHGFRFFPGFYRHVTDTMKRIPYQDPITGKGNPLGVHDNLVECTRIMMARLGQPSIYAPGSFPKSLADVELLVHDKFHVETGLTPEEKKLIAKKIWQLMTSCEARRTNEYEHIGWWEFTEAAKNSDNYRKLFVDGITRTLVAAKAESASTKTGGDIFLQLLFNMANPSVRTDRILCGPTNEVWLDPWLTYLQSKGVQYNFGSEVKELECNHEKITGVCVIQQGQEFKFTADYYICALPVERTAQLLKSSHRVFKLDHCLRDINTLAKSVAWMNGIQLYLKEDVAINKGHIILSDSPWALTAISQAQFWKNFDLSRYGLGDVKGVISVDVSNWIKPGLEQKKPAKDCSSAEVVKEVWEQMKQSLNVDGKVILEDSNLKLAHIDCDILFSDDIHGAEDPTVMHSDNRIQFGSSNCDTNQEPLLVNQVDTWQLRRESYTAVPNLFLASDYIKTYTDLATMEGANEAARRAVNNIIDASGVKAPYCKIWNLHEPSWLMYYKWLDEKRYKKGLDWRMDAPVGAKILNKVFNLVKKT